jgi:hypothetical protein
MIKFAQVPIISIQLDISIVKTLAIFLRGGWSDEDSAIGIHAVVTLMELQ